MESLRIFLKKELKNLGVEEEEALTVKLVTKKFKKKALKVHSDKTHNNDDEEFKELLNDYHKVKDAINEISNSAAEEDDEKTDLQNFFEKHNFAKEFSQSWTIYIEKDKVDEWKKEMSRRYPDFKKMQGNGTQYKTPMGDRSVSTTLYDVEIPKMNIQGNHSFISWTSFLIYIKKLGTCGSLFKLKKARKYLLMQKLSYLEKQFTLVKCVVRHIS